MKGENTYRNPLVRDGQSQSGRSLPALSPDYIKVDERDRDDLISFASEYSKLIQYYDESNQRNGDWGAFFKEGTSPDEPHYALFLAFTWLFRLLQKDLNTMTGRHLNHYYKEILQLKHKPAKADTVHLLFELAKNTEQQLLQKGTLLKAGKDALGKDLLYAIDKDIVLNKTKVVELKTLFQEPLFDENGKLRKVENYGLYASPKANSSDGLGADQDLETLSWKLLGESQEGDKNSMPKAEVGFGISSPILLLKEGTRSIRLDMFLNRPLYHDFLPHFLAITLEDSSLVQQEVTDLQNLLASVTTLGETSDALKVILDKVNLLLETALRTKARPELELDATFLTQGQEPQNERGKRIRTWWEKLGLGLQINAEEAAADQFSHSKTFSTLQSMMDYYLAIALRKSFVVSLSGAEEWIGPYTLDAIYGHSTHLALELELSVEDPAIVAYQKELLLGGFDATHPLMKVMLNQGDSYQYSILKDLRPSQFKIDVSARGVKDLVLQNDTANLNPNKTFQPFGPQSALKTNFYIGSAEAFQKKLSELTIHVDWADLPEDLKEHYKVFNSDLSARWDEKIKARLAEIDEEEERISATLQSEETQKLWAEKPELRKRDEAEVAAKQEKLAAYREKIAASKDEHAIDAGFFKGQFEMLNGGNWQALTNDKGQKELRLFDKDEPAKRSFSLTHSKDSEASYKRPNKIQSITKLDNQSLEGFVKLQLTGPSEGKFKGFGHSRFQKLYTEKIIEQLKPMNEEVTIELPNEPYTPAISAISLDYSSRLVIDIEEGKESHEKVFQIHPFGVAESSLKSTEEKALTVLPAHSSEGALYIGLEGLTPAQNLSILFQLNEKTVDHEFVGKVGVNWSYLHNNEWIGFDPNDILEDSTEVFTKPGIVTFQMPKEISDTNSLLPSGKYWIRATVPNNTQGVADALNIATQAITATFVDQGNDPAHLATALASKSIKKLRTSNSAIKSITQAYASFNGELKEQDGSFHTRVSERLRHKRRAISIWDYEHLILEAYPKVYKVKCLNHYDPEQSACGREMSPGAVTLIVLSRSEDETEVSRKLAPVTNVITLNGIKSLLKDITPPFIAARNKLFVKNPSYTRIKIHCAVKFNEGLDQVYYQAELQSDLMRLLSPWAFDEDKAINFERKLHKSLVINHIEELSYINFVCCFKVFKVQDGPVDQLIEGETITAAGPADILISNDEHEIHLVVGDTCDCDELGKDETKEQVTASGIGAMVIETNFKVAQNI
ncbi:MAG: hypothetical protein HEP71_07895 [Roseivirga sp.]|nr:hypothetical protein [Roseivirga sp.]